MDQTTQPPQLQPMQLPPKKHSASIIVYWLIIVVLLAASGYLGWQWWTLQGANATLQTENSTLRTQNEQLKAAAEAAEGESDPTATQPCDSTITDELKANIRDAISSKNLAALTGYMANPVTVILAASEGVGPRTPEQAVVDMEYLNSGTAPWDFNLPAATIAQYEAGFYKDYFDDNTLVGKSTNGMVVSIDFGECAKIEKVFMVANEDLLMP